MSDNDLGTIEECENRKQLAASVFGKRLKAWRKLKKIPQKVVATEIGVSVSVISEWERARRFPTASNLDKIVRMTGLPVCSLFYNHTSDSDTGEELFKLCTTCKRKVRRSHFQ